jgi:hypothetical protein
MAMMFLLAAAALTTQPAPPQSRPVSAVVQATATIRVINAVELKLDGRANPDAPPARDSVIKAADGSSQPAKLIEFQ